MTIKRDNSKKAKGFWDSEVMKLQKKSVLLDEGNIDSKVKNVM